MKNTSILFSLVVLTITANAQKTNTNNDSTKTAIPLKKNEIRYFNESDLVNANQLQADLKKYGLNATVKKIFLNSAVPNGQLEVWINSRN